MTEEMLALARRNAAEEGAFQGVVAVGSATTEAGDLPGGIQPIDGVPVAAQGPGVQVGLDAAPSASSCAGHDAGGRARW